MLYRYRLQAKRPHEKNFTEWCGTDDFEAIKSNIKTIESYGYQWQLSEDQEAIKEMQRKKLRTRRASKQMCLMGKRIKEVREAKGISQKELAQKILLSASALCLYEKGKMNISEQALYNIADALEMYIDELEGRTVAK